MTKQTVAVHVVVFLMFAMARAMRSDGQRIASWWPALALTGGCIAACAFVILPFVWRASASEVLYANVIFSAHYGAVFSFSEKVRLGIWETARFLLATAPWMVIAAVGVGVVRRGRFRSCETGLLLAWSLACWATVALPGRFSARYYVVLYPALALLTGAGATSFWPFRDGRPRAKAVMYALVVLALIIAALFNSPAYLGTTAADRHIARTPDSLHHMMEVHSPALAAELKVWLGANDDFYNLGVQRELYLYTGRMPATPYLHVGFFEADSANIGKVLADLDRAKPRYIIDTQWPFYEVGVMLFYPFEFRPFLDENYDYIGRLHYADIYRLKDDRSVQEVP